MSADKPHTIGKYELEGVVAQGGMATVHLAQHVNSGMRKRVAIKQIHSHLSNDPSFVRMFLDEARIALQVNHPNVCSVHEVGVEAGHHYLVMEYLSGTSLAKVLKAVRQTTRPADLQYAVARIIAEAAEGLHAAHEATDSRGLPLEIIHRDVSPQNVMITREGAVKVVDFGVARARERLEHTDTGQMKGKAGYLSPEQIAAQPVDRRADIWALGVCLWEALTLVHPFVRNNDPVLTMGAIAADPIVGPSGEGIHTDLNVIVKRAVCRNLNDRYSTAAQLSLALRAFLGRRNVVFEGPQLSRWVHAVCPSIAEPPKFLGGGHAIPTPAPGAEPLPGGTPTPLSRAGRRRSNHARVVLAAGAAALVLAGVVSARIIGNAEAAPRLSTEVPGRQPLVVMRPRQIVEAPIVRSTPVVLAPTPVAPAPVEPAPVAVEPTPAKPRRTARTAPVAEVVPVDRSWLRVVSGNGRAYEVRVNGVVRATPTLFTLPPGAYRVEVREPGDADFAAQQVELVGGIERTIRVELD